MPFTKLTNKQLLVITKLRRLIAKETNALIKLDDDELMINLANAMQDINNEETLQTLKSANKLFLLNKNISQ